MKKILATLLAVILALSVGVMAFAEGETAAATSTYKYVCEFCEAEFSSAADLKAHIDATFPVVGHCQACGNKCDKNLDGEFTDDECCTCVFTNKAAYEAHQTNCEFKDTRSNWDKAKYCLTEKKDFGAALKYAFNGIVEFVKSDAFKDVINKVVDVVKGIDLGGVVDTVKGVAGKIPFDKIGDAVKGLF